ncbi:MAG: putative secreted protein [Nocardioides sp.]|nr:putative secreted protein [Nocardioides sp.]
MHSEMHLEWLMKPLHGILAAVLAAVLMAPTQDASAHRTRTADPTVISDWNQIAVTALAADAATTPARKAGIEGYLYLAYMHAAMYNAVVGIEGRFQPYRFRAHPPRQASSEAAAVAAAHQVLATYFPEQQATVDAAYVDSLAGIPDGEAKDNGIAYGELAAGTLIAQRATDGRNDPSIQYTRAPEPGIWRPTPPALAPFTAPWLGFVDPLLVRSGAQFDPGPPPGLTSWRYTRDFQEVKDYGSVDSAKRTAQQTETALFWSGNPIAQFTAALRDQADLRHLDIAESARMFAAVHMSLADAAISIWHSKYVYALWRPITAIQLADTDGNPRTDADPDWTSLFAAPPYPEYVSGYNGVMGAFTQSLQETLGTRYLRLTFTSTAFPADDPRATRVYRTGREARSELIDARVWLGIHFRFADTAAAVMGQRVGHYALGHYFHPRHHHHWWWE